MDTTTEIPREVLALLPATLAHCYQALPLRREQDVLHMAVADPLDVTVLDELRLFVGCDIAPVVVTPQEMRTAIQRHYGIGAEAVERALHEGNGAALRPGPAAARPGSSSDDSSIASFVDALIRQAVEDRATDIHLEPFGSWVRIRQRVDGLLYDVPIPQELGRVHAMIVSRIKVMAKLNIAEKRLPQDGRMTVRLPAPGGEEELDLRVSVLPTTFGEAVDIRLLPSRMLYSLEDLGLAPDHLGLLEGLIERPHGIVFVTGPTGSGKTTTLYACLVKLNTVSRNILTIEDPVEYHLPGITQLQIHPKIGLSFAQGLRSMLRHDPDIMMVGEVRDPETAEITIRSALTGHLVFSTLHTNDAAGGVARLLDMGVEPYLVASSVLGFIAQRLVRVVCSACQEPVEPAPQMAEQFGYAHVPAVLHRGRGCECCKGTGYKGRTAIYEFLIVDDAVQALILRRASAGEIARAAQAGGPATGGAGMRTLRQDGWRKVLQGVTTPEEVLRVT